MKKVKISQSLIKELNKYFDGDECGHLIYERYTKGILSDPSDSQALGQYFEYKATGALPKGGVIPEPERTQKGELTAEYKRAEINAEIFKTLCKEMGIEILTVGEYREKNGMNGTRDLQVLWNGKKYTIDLKYSGLIDNDYDEWGWGDLYGSNDRMKQYGYHVVQAKQYTYIFEDPFIFWVFDPRANKEGDNIMIEMPFSDDEIEAHLEAAKDASTRWNTLASHNVAGFAARPEYNRCRKCVLFDGCEHKAKFPTPKIVTL